MSRTNGPFGPGLPPFEPVAGSTRRIGLVALLAELRRKAIGVRLWNVGRPLTLMP